ncbi:MAG: hypothetical protein PHR26_00410 [Candidatus ainarchaeum sp.]|nr:hypothetical protein [Candidatus ainarchaeum sp.]
MRFTLGVKEVANISQKNNLNPLSVSKKYQLLLKEVRKSYSRLSDIQKEEIKKIFINNPNVSYKHVVSVLSVMASRGKI